MKTHLVYYGTELLLRNSDIPSNKAAALDLAQAVALMEFRNNELRCPLLTRQGSHEEQRSQARVRAFAVPVL